MTKEEQWLKDYMGDGSLDFTPAGQYITQFWRKRDQPTVPKKIATLARDQDLIVEHIAGIQSGDAFGALVIFRKAKTAETIYDKLRAEDP